MGLEPAISDFPNRQFQTNAPGPTPCEFTIIRSWVRSHRRVRSHSSKHDTLTQCWTNVGPASQTVAKHWSNIGTMSRVFWYMSNVIFLDRLHSRINIQPDPKKIASKRFWSFWSVYPLMGVSTVFSNLTRGMDLQDEFSKWPPNASICTNVLYKLLF